MRHLRLITTFAPIAALAGCGGEPPLAASVAASADIRFEPGEVEIARGGTVTWEFAGLAHNVFFTSGSTRPDDIPDPTANATVSRTFPVAGVYDYECQIHPGMAGRVVVATPAPSSGPNTGPY
jgi:plastocyanin